MLSSKNFALSPAASDLGLGGQLKAELDIQEAERKKKLLQQAQALQGFGPATQSLFGAVGGIGA